MKHACTRAFLSAAFALSGHTYASDAVDYPDAYRQWTHVKSVTIHKGHPLETPFLGIHHIYANDRALKGLESHQYKDGASFAFDQLEYRTRDQASTEGPRVLLGVMVKDRARFPKTGGWGYEAWAGDSRTERLVDDGGVSCHGCHAQRKDQDFVFTEWRD